MISSHVLYIASNSASRKKLLEQANIPFLVIPQDADEKSILTDQPFSDIVMQIAQLKMQHAQIPAGTHEGAVCFVLTADTLGLSNQGRVLCKPVDRQDAISMLNDARQGTVTATGFCLRKMSWQHGVWVIEKEVVDFDRADSIFDVPDAFLDYYLQSIPYLSVSGAVSIEGVGGQFLKSVHGSYETIVGLPMFKIRHSLYEFGFYE
jgi:septum formation protein